MVENCKWFLNLDFLSVEGKLFTNQNVRYKNKFGVWMSILSILLVLLIGNYFIFLFFSGKDLNILFQTINKDYYYVYDLKGKAFFFRLQDVNSGKEFDPRIATTTVLYFMRNSTISTTIELETEKCSFETNLIDYKNSNILDVSNISSWKCFKQNVPLNLTNNSTEQKTYYFSIYVRPCVNSSKNNNNCFPKQEILNKLNSSSINFQYYFPSFDIDHSDIYNPIKENVMYKTFKIFPSMYYSFYEYMKIVNYTTDNGFLMENKKTWQMIGRDPFTSFYFISISGVNKVPNSFTVIQFFLTPNSIDKYIRHFMKIKSVIANIGGAMNLILFLSKNSTEFISSRILYVNLLNEFVHYEDPEVNEKNKPTELPMYTTFKDNYLKNSQKKSESSNQINEIIIKNNDNLKRPNVDQVNEYSIYGSIEKTIPQIFIKNLLKKKRKLTILESILPYFCIRKSVLLNDIEIISKIIRSIVSTEGILKLFQDFDKIKYLILEENQLLLFDFMMPPSLSNFQQILNHRLNINNPHYEKMINVLKNSESPLAQKLLAKIYPKIDNNNQK